MEGYICCSYTGGLSWIKSCSGISLNSTDVGIDSMLIKADNLTKLKRPANTWDDRLRNQNDPDKLKLQSEKKYGAVYQGQVHNTALSQKIKIKHYANQLAWEQPCIKGLDVTGCVTLVFQFWSEVRCWSKSLIIKLCFTPQIVPGG